MRKDNNETLNLVICFDYYHYKKQIWFHSWGNILPFHLNTGWDYSYHNFNGGNWIDYSGGLIITDWYSEEENNQSIKITVRFLSNEIRADGLKITLHQRICGSNNSCAIKQVESGLNEEIKATILKKAALMKKAKEEKDPTKNYKNKKTGEITWCGDDRIIC